MTLPFEEKYMISVTGVTNKYSVQPALLEKHTKTLSWLSSTMHWKSELAFFQKLLNELGAQAISGDTILELEGFENQIHYFIVEEIEDMRKKLRNHESQLAKMLEVRSEWDIQYYKEHDALMNKASELSDKINTLVTSLRVWRPIQNAIHNHE